MADDEIKVTVSGRAVYKAVKNYLNNSVDMKNEIKNAVDGVMTGPDFNNFIRERMANSMNFNWKKEVHDIIREEVKSVLGAVLMDDIKSSVLHALVQHLTKNMKIENGTEK